MNMFARFDKNPAMTLQDIKETKRYGRTDNVKTVNPTTNKVWGGGGYNEQCEREDFGDFLQACKDGINISELTIMNGAREKTLVISSKHVKMVSISVNLQ